MSALPVPLQWLKALLRPLVRRIRELPDLPLVLAFVTSGQGRTHGVTPWRKWRLARRIIGNSYRVRSGSNWRQHLRLVDEILRIPSQVPGDVVECGCYNGASSASLSLACALTGRRLLVCDSFEGLPEPEEAERYEIHSHDQGFYYVWEKGEFQSAGGLDGVRQVVGALGELSVCTFVQGYFNATLATLPSERLVLVFEDADLASSVRDCLLTLWPRLQEGCRFFCHEPWSINVVGLFYDRSWWQQNLGHPPPGFQGSGQGVPLFSGLSWPWRWWGWEPSVMGYAEKFDFQRVREQGGKIIHHGSSGFQEGQGGRFVDGRWQDR
ncbi:MAG: class I SAM-dependent methyltransferase [Magnetococcales bacterium]|nr:class I SAM-dependent methyltransferase [Magnetococcales bacterium]